MGDGERIKLTIAPLTEQPSSGEEFSANIRASLQSASATPERPLRLALDVDSTPIPSVATSPSATFRVGCFLTELSVLAHHQHLAEAFLSTYDRDKASTCSLLIPVKRSSVLGAPLVGSLSSRAAALMPPVHPFCSDMQDGMSIHRRGVTEDLEALENTQSRGLSDLQTGRGVPLSCITH